jgi:hypothetical protein
MPVILGKYGMHDDTGWTQIIPYNDGTSANSKFYYVHPTHPSATDDVGNPGTDPATPLLTIARAGALIGTYNTVSNRRADWILLAEGETASYTGDPGSVLLIGAKGGFNSQNPFVLTSYNPNLVGITATNPRGAERAAPPTISFANTTGSAGTEFIINMTSDNQWGATAIIGVDFYCSTGDPINNPGGYDDTHGACAISLSRPMDGSRFIMEDVHLKGGVVLNVGGSGGSNATKSIVMRRNSVQYGGNGSGINCSNAAYFLYEENFMMHCGWAGSGPAANPDQLTRATSVHGIYGDSNALGAQQRWIYRGNFHWESSDTSFRCRHGGHIYDNLSFRDQHGIETGLGNLVSQVDPLQCVNYHLHDNVLLESGRGDDLGGTDVSGGGAGFLLASSGTSGPQNGVLSRNLVAHCAPYGARAYSGPSDNNWTVNTNNVAVDYRAGDDGGTPTGPVTGGLPNPGIITDTGSMSDSTYTLDDYATGHMGLANLAAFLTNRRAQRRYNWDERYHATYINNVIRGFYNMDTDIDNRPSYISTNLIPGRFLSR